MKKKTKIVLTIIGAAAVGGVLWYMRKNQKKAVPVFAPAPTLVKSTASTTLPKAMEDFLSSGSVKTPITTTPTVTQQVSTPVYTKPLVEPVSTIDPIAKVYPTIQPITQTFYTKPITKESYLMERELSLAGLLL